MQDHYQSLGRSNIIWITSTPVWVEFPTSKKDGRSNYNSGSGDIPGQVQRKKETEKNGDKYPQLSDMEKHEEIFNPVCWEGRLCPMVTDGKEIYIQFH